MSDVDVETEVDTAAARLAPANALCAWVEQTITPVLAHAGYELIWVEFVSASQLLRLYVDKPGGLTLHDCSLISRRVGDILAAEAPPAAVALPQPWRAATAAPQLQPSLGRHTLEVSSPGMARPLVTLAHFQRFLGRQLLLHLQPHAALPALQGKLGRKLTGNLLSADAHGIRIALPEGPLSLAYSMVARAQLVPSFVQPSKKPKPKKEKA